MIYRISTLFLIIGVIISLSVTAQTINTQKLDSLFNILSSKNLMMGSIVISQNDKIVYKKSFGYRFIDGDKKIAADENTKYRVGSVTKLFTSVMIFQLEEEHKLSLDTKLSTFYPQIKNADKITIADMMRHRSGIHDISNDKSFQGRFFEAKTNEEILSILYSVPSDFTPDTKFAYSNSNFILLGYIVEKLDKNSYQKSLEKRILNKLHLTNTFGFKDIKDMSLPYRFLENQWYTNEKSEVLFQNNARNVAGAGTIISSPKDLNIFMNAMFGNVLINKESLAQMMTLKDGVGMDMYKLPFDDKFIWGHNGQITLDRLTYYTDLYHNIESDLTVGICYNGVNYETNDILVAILSCCYDAPFDLSSLKEEIQVDSSILSRYVGLYVSKQMPLKIKVFSDKSQLYAQADGQSALPLSAGSEKEFIFKKAGIVMIFDAEKKSFILKQRGAEYLFTKE